MFQLAIVPCPTGPAAAAPEEVPVSDEWHTLLLAVRTRLRDVLDGWPVAAATPQQRIAAERSHAMALDCADALDRLHESLIDHDHRHRRLAFELLEVRAELARLTASS